jgi:D-alanyl-D-alanine carboxypeptidase
MAQNKTTPTSKAECFLQNLVEENKTPSVNYIIFSEDSIIHQFVTGYADINNKIKANEGTMYHAYSITKTLTALAVLQLAEQKKLDIGQPVKKYLPQFPYPADITVQQLLAHSAGIPSPIPLSWIHLPSEHPSFDRNLFFKQIIEKNNKVKSKPNAKFSYSNLGYVLLGQLIEKCQA